MRRVTNISMTAVIAVMCTMLPHVAHGEFRHALVIGQSTYKTGTLTAPPRDVAAVAAALDGQGFTVTRLENIAAVKDLDEALTQFARSVPTGGTALIYYSGQTATVPVHSGTNPPRQDAAMICLDGGRRTANEAVARLTVGPYSQYSPGDPVCGSRINVVIIDAVPPPAKPAAPAANAAPAAAAPSPPADAVPGRDTLIILRPAGPAAADAAKPSPLAEKLVAGLTAKQPLGAVLGGLSPRIASSLAAGELDRLTGSGSRAVSPPTSLAPAARPGDEWVNANGMVFCWCPPGRFTIGSPPTERDRQPDEAQAVVSFADGFWMAKHELCYRESAPLAGGAPYMSGDHKLTPINYPTGSEWTAKLLAALNKTAPAGWEYGLPTEAEWEYAARAGTTTAYSFGDDPAELARFGNFADRSLRESDSFGESAKGTPPKSNSQTFGDRQKGIFSYAHPTWSDGAIAIARVGSYLPNPWGLCDMHGNVTELTSVVYDAQRLGPIVPPEKAGEWGKRPENQKKYRLPLGFLGHVTKGGSWASSPGSCRSAQRGWSALGSYETISGQRIVLRRKGYPAESPARWTNLVPSSFAATSGATATPAADGSLLVTGTVVAGDTYTITCPLPAGGEPFAVRLDVLTDPTLPKQGPGRSGDGSFSLTEVSIAGTRGAGQPVVLPIADAESDFAQFPPGCLTDGNAETFARCPGDGKERQAVFMIGIPTRTGYDGGRWRSVESVAQGPLSSLTVTIVNHKGHVPLGKFRLSVMRDDPTPAVAPANTEAAR